MSAVLTGKIRETIGTSSSRKARVQGYLPAVLYGNKDNLSIVVDPQTLAKLLKQAGRNAVIDLNIEGDSVENRKVILKTFQRHPLKELWVHADFMEIDMTKKIRVRVPIHTVGIAPGEKLQGGVLNHALKELEVECLPEDIPQKIEVSIAKLELGQAIHVSDLPLPDKLTATTAATTAIVTVYKEKEEKASAAETDEGDAEAAPEKGTAASGEGDAGKKGG